MSIRYIPLKRYTDRGERVDYPGLQLLAAGKAIVEPETVDRSSWDQTAVIAAIEATYPGTIPRFAFTKLNTDVIGNQDSAVLDEIAPAPTDATADTVVAVHQIEVGLYLTGYIEILAGTLPVTRFVAHNHSLSPVTMSAGEVINYAVHVGSELMQPNTPNAELPVTPQIQWVDDRGQPTNTPVTVDTLNMTALPSISIPDHSITAVELNSNQIQQLAALYTGFRMLFTLTAGISVPVGFATDVGTVVFPTEAGKIVWVGEPGGQAILYTGFISATGGGNGPVTIQARNLFINTIHTKAATLKVMLY